MLVNLLRSLNITTTSLWGVLPTGLLVVAFVFPLATGKYLPFTSEKLLGVLVQVEWLVMVSGLFLIFVLAIPATTKTGRIVSLIFVLLISGAFAASGAWEVGRWYGVFLYYMLLFFSYGLTSALRVHQVQSVETLHSIIRWTVLIFVFFGLVAAVDLPSSVENWQGREAELLGALFFSALLVLELTFFDWLVRNIEKKREESASASENERTEGRRRFYGLGKKRIRTRYKQAINNSRLILDPTSNSDSINNSD